MFNVKKISLKIGERVYRLRTDSSDEEIEYVQNCIDEEVKKYESLVNEIEPDDLVVIILCDILSKEWKCEVQVDNLVRKIAENEVLMLEDRSI
jgi:hypothetical protein